MAQGFWLPHSNYQFNMLLLNGTEFSLDLLVEWRFFVYIDLFYFRFPTDSPHYFIAHSYVASSNAKNE